MPRARSPRPEPALAIDFVEGALAHRLRSGHARGEPLVRAAGVVRGQRPAIVDATAGLGRDAFLLASLGCEVTLIERSPEIHALLNAALERARAAGPELAAIIGRMTLILGDARERIAGLAPEVVLVDPMHPPRGNSALVKQEMRLLRGLVGTDPDAAELMHAALSAAGRRVVLKWPLRAEPMPGLPPPSHTLLGKTVRYDVFVTGGAPTPLD